jgi:hypothetical protein
MPIHQEAQTHERTSLIFPEALLPTTETASLIPSNSYGKRWIRSMSPFWFPGAYEDEISESTTAPCHPAKIQPCSFRRRIFLLLTEPESSICSAIFFSITVLAIALMNVILVLQTMEHWQFTPKDCKFCGETVSYGVEVNFVAANENDSHNDQGIPCACPPLPLPWTVWLLDRLVRFFTVEWILRVFSFDTPPAIGRSETGRSTLYQRIVCDWIPFLTSSSTLH